MICNDPKCTICNADVEQDEQCVQAGKFVEATNGIRVLYFCGPCWIDVQCWVDASRGELGFHDEKPSSTC